MRKSLALIVAVAGLILAVGVPVTIAVAFNIDLGRRLGFLIGGMLPGIGVLILAGKLWRGDATVKRRPDEIPPGHQVCELCGQAAPASEGVARLLNPQTPLAGVAFVCHACSRYRTKRALLILACFLAGLGVLALVVQLTIPKPQKK